MRPLSAAVSKRTRISTGPKTGSMRPALRRKESKIGRQHIMPFTTMLLHLTDQFLQGLSTKRFLAKSQYKICTMPRDETKRFVLKLLKKMFGYRCATFGIHYSNTVTQQRKLELSVQEQRSVYAAITKQRPRLRKSRQKHKATKLNADKRTKTNTVSCQYWEVYVKSCWSSC